MNKVTLIGRVGAVQVRESNAGIRLATTRQGKDAKETEWHDLVAFGRLRTVVEEHLVKGRHIAVCGRLHTSRWTKDGVSLQRTEIVVEELIFLDPPDRLGAQAKPAEVVEQEAGQ